MDFLLDFALLGLVVIGVTAFLGILTTKLAEGLGGKKKRDALEHTLNTKNGWKPVQRKRT